MSLSHLSLARMTCVKDITRYLATRPHKSNLENLRALKQHLTTASNEIAGDLQQSVLACVFHNIVSLLLKPFA